MHFTQYSVLMLVGIVVSAVLWVYVVPREARGPLMVVVYAAGLLGAFLGAKVVYLLVEWPFYAWGPDAGLKALYGKTVTGALLGGYGGVELGKKLIGFDRATGDVFAVVVPVSLAIGRVGCVLQGCCLGRPCGAAWYAMVDGAGVGRYPSAVLEGVFNLVAGGVLVVLSVVVRRGGVPTFRGQLFHLYLLVYGVFRFGHEFVRDTPRVGGVFSPYQFVALGIVGLGVWRLRGRAGRGRGVTAVPPDLAVSVRTGDGRLG